MNPALAYFLGILTIVFVISIYWFLSTKNEEISNSYKGMFCSGIA